MLSVGYYGIYPVLIPHKYVNLYTVNKHFYTH